MRGGIKSVGGGSGATVGFIGHKGEGDEVLGRMGRCRATLMVVEGGHISAC